MLETMRNLVMIVAVSVPVAVAMALALIGFPTRPFVYLVKMFLFLTIFLYAVVGVIWAMFI